MVLSIVPTPHHTVDFPYHNTLLNVQDDPSEDRNNHFCQGSATPYPTPRSCIVVVLYERHSCNELSNQRLTFRLQSWTQKKRLGHTKGFPSQTQKLELHTKQIAPCERTAEEVSFEWSHHRISTLGLAPEVCSQNERTISTVSIRKKYALEPRVQNFIHRLKS